MLVTEDIELVEAGDVHVAFMLMRLRGGGILGYRRQWISLVDVLYVAVSCDIHRSSLLPEGYAAEYPRLGKSRRQSFGHVPHARVERVRQVDIRVCVSASAPDLPFSYRSVCLMNRRFETP